MPIVKFLTPNTTRKVDVVAPGDMVLVHESQFCGTPACRARVIELFDQGYIVQELSEGSKPNGENFEIDDEGYVLIGPPLHGKLVRAP